MPDSDLPEMGPLQTATLLELIHEIKSRHDGCLFIGVDAKNGSMNLCWGGYGTHAIGLANYAAARLMGMLAAGTTENGLYGSGE